MLGLYKSLGIVFYCLRVVRSVATCEVQAPTTVVADGSGTPEAHADVVFGGGQAADDFSLLQKLKLDANMSSNLKRSLATSFLATSSRLTNPAGRWEAGCQKFHVPTGWYLRAMNRYLANHGNQLPAEMYKDYLERRKAVRFLDVHSRQYFYKADAAIKMCSTAGEEARARFLNIRKTGVWGINTTEVYLDKGLASVPDNGVVILLPFDGFWNDNARQIMSNNLCGLRRLGLLDRTMVFFVNYFSRAGFDDDRNFLSSSFPELNVVHDPELLGNIFRSQQATGLDDVWLRWRYLPLLLLLERGYQVLTIDADIAWIQNPLAFLQSIRGDIAYNFESCMEMNAGFGFYRPTQNAKRMLEIVLGMNTPTARFDVNGTHQEFPVAWADDQSLLNCAATYSVVNFGLQVHLPLTTQVAFNWPLITKSFVEKCYGATADVAGDFLIAAHTSGTALNRTIRNLRMLGLWELAAAPRQDDAAQCVLKHDPLAACRQGLPIKKESLLQVALSDDARDVSATHK